MSVYIPLKGDSKVPAVSGWADHDYEGVEPEGRVGLRADGLVIVDCDSREAYDAWPGDKNTYTVKTPRGYHLYFKATGVSATLGPRVGVMPGVDIRAGSGSYVVAPPTPGYEVFVPGPGTLPGFNPDWLPESAKQSPAAEGWDDIPDGRRNAVLFDIGSRLRGAGMSDQRIVQMLAGFNKGLCKPPLDAAEVTRIAASVCGYAPGEQAIEIILEGEGPDWGEILWADTIATPEPPE